MGESILFRSMVNIKQTKWLRAIGYVAAQTFSSGWGDHIDCVVAVRGEARKGP